MNQKRYWLRGGIVAIIIYAIWWLKGAFNAGFEHMNYVTFEWSVIGLVAVVAIGAIIGWLYGKIKNRNKNQPVV